MNHGSAEINAGGGGRLGRFSRGYHKLHLRIVEGPDYVPGAETAAADDPEIVAASADSSLPLSAEGEIDPKHNDIRAARAQVEAAFPTHPAPQRSIEDVMGRAA